MLAIFGPFLGYFPGFFYIYSRGGGGIDDGLNMICKNMLNIILVFCLKSIFKDVFYIYSRGGGWIVDRGSWIVDRGSWIVDRGSMMV